jgi:hypothetical protein
VPDTLSNFLIISTCFLYLVAAGLFSRGVWYLENNTWNHAIGGDAAAIVGGIGPTKERVEDAPTAATCDKRTTAIDVPDTLLG